MATEVTRATREEYLAMERASEEKHEFLDGEIVAMTGASEEHNLIVGNLIRELGVLLKGRPGKVYPSDMRVRIPAENRDVYPDVIAMTAAPQFEEDERDTLLNPQVIFEVLSRSTEAYDRGAKFASYRTLPSFTEYVLVSQDRVQVEHFVRQADGRWLLESHASADAILELPTLACKVSLGDIYYNVPAGE